MAHGFKSGGKDFKPGVVTNPSGRPKETATQKTLKNINSEELAILMNQYHNKTLEDLTSLAQDKSLPMSHHIVIATLRRAYKSGNPDILYDRMVGKVKQVVENVGEVKETYVEKRLKQAESLLFAIFQEDNKRALETIKTSGLIGNDAPIRDITPEPEGPSSNIDSSETNQE